MSLSCTDSQSVLCVKTVELKATQSFLTREVAELLKSQFTPNAQSSAREPTLSLAK